MSKSREYYLNQKINQYINHLINGGVLTPSDIKRDRIKGSPEDVEFEALGILISDGLVYRSEYYQPSMHVTFKATHRLQIMKERGLINSYLTGFPDFEGAWHPEIEKSSRDAFSKGRFDSAIMEATKALEIAIREASGLTKSMKGSDLAINAFKPGGPLYRATTDGKEDNGFQFLAHGIVLAFRNPTHHYDVGYNSPIETGQIISFISFMMSVIDKRNPKKDTNKTQ